MSEFKLHHLIGELLDSLESKGTPGEFIDYLQRNTTANKEAPAHVIINKEVQELVHISSNPQAFLHKYEDLKQKNVDGLEAYVQFLYKISQDTGVKNFLYRISKKSGVTKASPQIPMTKDDLPQVKNILKKAVTRQSVHSETVTLGHLSNSNSTISTPSVAMWLKRRPTMSWDFGSSRYSGLTMTDMLPPHLQENALMEDLLNILTGLPGCYIEPEELKDPFAERTFKISEQIDQSLADLVGKILPIASYYSTIQRFVEQKMGFEYGQVNNALAEVLGELITDYICFITQLETELRSGNLNLQKMLFYVQRNEINMSIAAAIASTISKSDAKGGKVLSFLHEYINESISDKKAEDLCVHLMKETCVPYMRMLSMWIYKGIICDPIKEFLVEDNEVLHKEEMPVDYSADYWVKKYTIPRERIPIFLEPVADIILRAGKYLNVIRQCGKPINTQVEPLQYTKDSKEYIRTIEKAYTYASQTLLDLILKEKDLVGRLRSVKHYFLLDQGDLIVTLLTLCEKELNKDVGDVVQARLESLLDLALRLSSAVNDPYKDDLRTELLPYDLQFQMFKILSIQTTEEQEYWSSNGCRNLTLIESFSFSYEVHWPLSLILNRRSLACYQMIFRHLFYCKHVERMICQVWKSNKVAKKFPFSSARQYRTAFALRQRMLHCVQNFEYHMMVEVIEPHWCTFLQKIMKVNNVDEILSYHSDFLDSCLKDCMLTIPDLLSTITKLLSIIVNFCKFMQNETVLQANQSSPEQMESFEDSITRFNVEFTAALMQLLDQISELNRNTSDHEMLFNLLYRFDFNSFYTAEFEKMGLTMAKMKINSSG